MFSATVLVLVLALFKVIYERWVTPLSSVPGRYLHSVTSLPMRYHMLRGSLPEFLLALHREFGPLVRISPQRVSIADADMVRHVLGSHSYGKTPSYDMPTVLEANAFSTRSAEVSTERRKQLAAGFSHRHLLDMEDRIVQCGVINVERKIDKLLEGAKGGDVVVQYYKWFSLIALDTIGILGFGRHFGALDSETHELVPTLVRIRIFNYVTMAIPWLKKVPALMGRRLTPLTRLVDFGRDAIAQRREQAAEGTIDLLQLMLDSGQADKRLAQMSDAQIVSESILHLIAGVDTTSAGLTWTLALLLHNPLVMARAVAEVRAEYPQGRISFEECRKLPYLGAVIHESLRVMSPAPGMLPRLAPPGGVRLGGYFLPAGTWLCCAIGAVHMNPGAFGEPERFDPERFLGGEERFNMLAFSTGVRACLGRNLALVEMHVVLANLLRNYDLALPGGVSGKGGVPDIPRKTMMTMNPSHPDRDCLVLVSPRSGL